MNFATKIAWREILVSIVTMMLRSKGEKKEKGLHGDDNMTFN